MPKKIDEMGSSTEPIDISNETAAHALGITEQRNTKLMWYLDEIMESRCSKAEGMRRIAALETTQEEKVYMGYMLCKRIVILKTPTAMRPLLGKMYGL
jgi:hypothetical protein